MMTSRLIGGQVKIVETVKLLIFKEDPTLFEQLNRDLDNVFLEPLLFIYFNFFIKVDASKELFREILQGYLTNSKHPEIKYLFNNNNVAYIPRLGYYKKGFRGKYEPLLFTECGTFEVIKHESAFLNKIFSGLLDRSVEPHNFYLDETLFEINLKFLSRAFTFIRYASPKHFLLIKQSKIKCVFFKTDPTNTNSFATINAHGLAFFNVYQEDYDEVFFVDDIAHQTGHIILTTLLFDRKEFFLVDESFNIDTITRETEENRTLYVLFHALYTYYTTLMCLDNCLMYDLFKGKQILEAKGRIGFYIKKFQYDLIKFHEIVNHFGGLGNMLTPDGIEIYEMIKGHLFRIREKWHHRTKDFDYGNQPYNFNFQIFNESNSI